ncbi:MAG TPA: cellulase family glycosylhydrolase [Marmoricola sp.]|nr:cellulase family glycosylhydrolase [Marmoricola sp.]
MRRLPVLVLTVLLALVAAPARAADPGPGVPRLHREGGHLVDQYGRTVIVHGLNLVWKRAPYAPPDTPGGFTTADADWLQRYGFNGARIGMLWAGVTPDRPDTADPAYFSKWDRVVNLLADRGIWMQFDQHQDMWHETYGGEGVPDWAAKRPLPFSLAPYAPVPFPEGYWTPEVSTVFDNFWADQGGLQDDWATYWKLVAEHYRDQPYSMGYDLMNEPWAGLEWSTCMTTGCPQTYSQELQPAMTKALQAVRQVDPQGIVWWEPQQLNSGLQTPTFYTAPPGDEQNLGYSWHNYCPWVFLQSSGVPGFSSDNCRSFSENREQAAQAQADTMHAAPLMSEWGATDDTTAIGIDADVADQHQMGWMYWAYKHWDDPTTADASQGLFTDDADLSTVKTAKLRQLVRTYPQATAGTLEGYHYDVDTGRFTMTFRADPSIHAPTRIFVSPLTSPHGFDVSASSGDVAVHGSYVDLRTDSAEEIQVTITPRV